MLKNLVVLLTLTTALTAAMPRSQAETLPPSEGAKLESTDSGKGMKPTEQVQEEAIKPDTAKEVKAATLEEKSKEDSAKPVTEK